MLGQVWAEGFIGSPNAYSNTRLRAVVGLARFLFHPLFGSRSVPWLHAKILIDQARIEKASQDLR